MSRPTAADLLRQLDDTRTADAERASAETSTEWGVRVEHPRLPGFTSAVTNEAHADRLMAQADPGATVTKVRREVTEWEDVQP